METNKKKNKIVKILLSVFVLILIAVGASYAYSNWEYIGETNTISSQEVSIDLLESNSEIINITNAIPMTDEEGLAQSDSFAFAVTSKISQEKVINYIVSMQKLTPDTGYTFLNDNKIKIYIEDFEGNEVLEPTLVSNLNNYELTKGFHDHDSSHVEIQNKYRLKVWIDQSAESSYDWSTSLNLQYKFKLGVTAEDQATVKHTVNVVVNNGTVSPSTKQVVHGDRAQFTLTPTNSSSEGVVSCTNSQTGTIKNNTLTVSNVTNNTTCTVTFSPASTVLYTDGTLIINEKPSDRSANITTHGAVTTEYAPLSNQNAYVFDSYTSQLWYSQRNNITAIEIGKKTEPTKTAYWFYNLLNMATGDFTNLDTKNVTDMSYMFERAGYNSSVALFELTGLSNWDTSQVTNMKEMFYGAGHGPTTCTIGDLSNWDVSKVTDMTEMFRISGFNATNYRLNLSNWNALKVTTMNGMFQSAGYSSTTFELNLSNWNTSNVRNMSRMFETTGANATSFLIIGLNYWDTSKVTTMYDMFYESGYHAATFNLDLSNWDVSSVTNMNEMFNNVGSAATTWSIGDLSNWDTSQVTNMGNMFSSSGYNATTWDIGNLSNWDTSKVTTMGGMFSHAGYHTATFDIGNLSNWDTSKVTTMGSMFYQAGHNATSWHDIGILKVYATNMNSMFYDCIKAKATLNIYSIPSSYTTAFSNAATESGSLIAVNYNCTTVGIANELIATKSASSNVVMGTNFEGTCPDRTVNVVVNNGTVNTTSITVPNLGSATFNLAPTSGYGYPSVSCTNNQNGSIANNVLTVSNVLSDTTCTVTYYNAEAISLTDNDATYPWVETSGVWKSGNYNVNSTTSTITSQEFVLTENGTLSFEWSVSSESVTYDYLYYTIYKDGSAMSGTGTSTKIGGNNTVTQEADLVYTTVTKELEPGTYKISYTYRKDSSTHKGLDRGYVKNIFVLK